MPPDNWEHDDDTAFTGDEVDNNDTEKETPPMNRPASAF